MTARTARAILACLFVAAPLHAPAASLDLVADAVVGKANFTAPPSFTPSDHEVSRAAAVAEDPLSGALWVVDSIDARVLRFSSAAAFANGEAANLVIGQANFTGNACNRGGTRAANTLCGPNGLAVDQVGRLYVSDAGNHRILIFRPPFATGMNASTVLGQADFTSGDPNRGGTPTSSTLSNPRGISVDARGYLFVADGDNNRVLRYPGTSVSGTAANKVFGQPDSSTVTANTGGLSASSLHLPMDAKVDGDGHLWVADVLNHRVLRFDGGSDVGDTVADLVLCQAGFTTATSGITASTCNQPIGVAIDAGGVVYLADYANARMLRFTTLANGAAATAVIGQATFIANQCNQGLAAPTVGTLCGPTAPILDRSGNLIVPDATNGRVLRFDQPRSRVVPTITALSPATIASGTGAFVLTVTGKGFQADSVVNWNGSPRQTQYLSPRRLLAAIPASDLAIAGPYAIVVSTPAPGGGTSLLRDLPVYLRAALDGAADRVLGQSDFTSSAFEADAIGEEQVGAINAATIPGATAFGIAIDPRSGRLFVGNTVPGRRVLSWPSVMSFQNGESADVVLGQETDFDQRCTFSPAPTAASLCSPYDMAVDAAGALYVSDTSYHRVLKFVPPFSTGMAASRVFGQGGSFSTIVANNGGIGPHSLSSPRGLAVGAGGLFVHDSGNHRILNYPDPDASFTATVAIGQPDLVTGTLSPVSASRLNGLHHRMLLDAAGRLFASDTSNHRVLRFSPPFATNMPADLVIGQVAFTANVSATTATGLNQPAGVALDPAGNLLVADSGNNRVLRYAAPFTNGMAATGLLGQADFASATTGTSATRIHQPMGLALDWLGNVYVSELFNARVLAFDRPFAFALDQAGDIDRDGIPNFAEPLEGRDTYAKDNDVFANTRLFAMQQYRDFLSREGDTGGIAYWIAQLAGPQTRAQAIQGFFTSPEFQGVIAPVARLYFANFLRYPDYGGLQFHVARSRTGTALDVIASDFATSPEFVGRYGALTNDAFIELVYNNVLGRPSDPVGKAYWLAQMTGGATRGQVMLGFSESPEYVAAIGNEVFITMMYVGMLRRAPDAVGFSYWLNLLDGGTSGLALTQGFLDAPEYRGRFLP